MKTAGYYLLIMTWICALIAFGCSKPGDQTSTQNPPVPPPSPDPPTAPPPVVPPLVIDSAAYLFIGGFDSLFSFDPYSGKRKWSVKINNYVTSSPAYWNGTVYIGCSDDKLYAFDTLGKLKWTYSADADLSTESPTVDKGKVYINSFRGPIYCIDAITGQLIWRHNGISTGGRNLLLNDGTIYMNGVELIAVDASTGELKWSYPTMGEARPVVFNDKVYAAGNGVLYVVNAKTGALIWRKDSYGSFYEPVGINIGNGFLYCLNEGATSNLIACDTSDGSVKWVKSTGKGVGGGKSFAPERFPVLYDSILFFPAEYGLYAYDAFTGAIRWKREFDETTSGGTVVNNIIYCSTRSIYRGRVMAFEASTGKSIWASDSRYDFNLSMACVVTKSGKMHRLAEVYN